MIKDAAVSCAKLQQVDPTPLCNFDVATICSHASETSVKQNVNWNIDVLRYSFVRVVAG